MGIRCVIVDDSEHFRFSARRLLSAQGISILADAADSRQALRAVDEQHPDVVLVDVHLGVESGFDLAERIRSSSVIMMSASVTRDEVEDLMPHSPAIGFLPKDELSADAIKRMLSQRDRR
jgi:DNA-binding NarL/FixJ family response regulator